MVKRFERFSYSIFSISRCWHRIAGDVMEEYGLKGPHAQYIIALDRGPKELTASRLGELCGRDKADVSRAVNRLEELGYLRRCSPGESGYRAVLELTDKGRSLARQVENKAAAAVKFAGRDLSEEERTNLYRALESVADNLTALTKRGL